MYSIGSDVVDQLRLSNSLSVLIGETQVQTEASSIITAPAAVLPLYNRVHAACVACGHGDNSTAHWTRFCVVPLVVANFSAALTPPALNLAQIAAMTDRHVVIASVVVHQFRRLLLERGGMCHQREGDAAAQWDTMNWINTLGQSVQRALPRHVSSVRWPVAAQAPSDGNVCMEHHAGIVSEHTDPLHLLALTRADQVILAAHAALPGQELCRLPAGHGLLKLLRAQSSSALANAKLERVHCDCTVPHFSVIATRHLAPSDLLNVGTLSNETTPPYLLCQFDGGCHQSERIGGAGFAIYLVYPTTVQLYKYRAIGLCDCKDNVVAEVKACRHLIDEVIEVGTTDLATYTLLSRPVIVQGDILPVIKYLSFAGRLRRHDLLQDLEHIQLQASRWIPHIQWRALPREANELADDLAGQALSHMLERRLKGRALTTDLCLRPQLPYDKLLVRGAEPAAIIHTPMAPHFTLCEKPSLQWSS